MVTPLRIRRRAARPPAEALDRSLSHVRLLVGLAGAVLSAWLFQREMSTTALVGLAACLIVCALAPGERPLRRWVGVGKLSALMTATDTVLILVVLWLNGVEPGDPASLLLVLPLVEAGIRHGSFGVVVTWTTIALAMFGELAITWNGAPEQAKDPMKVAMILLVVGLPGGRLAEHLAFRVHAADQLALDASNRADLLMQVFEGAAELSAVDGAARDARLTAVAGRMLGGAGSIAMVADLVSEASETAPRAGRARVERTAVGAAVRVELGGTPPRVLRVATTELPGAAAVEAVELLVANYRTHGRAVSSSAIAVTTVEASVVASVAVDPESGRPAGRAIEDLIADRTPSDEVLDRPELDAHLVQLLHRGDGDVDGDGDGDGDVGLVVVSLDNLKLMNDLHGRAAGDRLIAATTRRLRRLDGPSRTTGQAAVGPVAVGWMGGDDFVVVFEKCDQTAALLTEMVRTALAGRVDIGRFGPTRIHAGIGGAVASPGDDFTGPQLMREASAQMIADRRAQNRRFLEAADFEFDPGDFDVDRANLGADADVADRFETMVWP